MRQTTPNNILDAVLSGAGAAQPAATKVAIKDIINDGGTQMRASLNFETVSEYAEAMLAGVTFPPITLYYDGETYWLADGFHRLQAWKSIYQVAGSAGTYDPAEVPAIVHAGTRRDAILHAAGANANHGLRRTNEDKRRAVEVLLRDPEWSQWSDRVIAEACAVSNKFVSSLRNKMTVNGTQSPTERKGADGRTINTQNIGSNRPARLSDGDLTTIVQTWMAGFWRRPWPENPSHTNGTLWQGLTAWLHENVRETWHESQLKEVIKRLHYAHVEQWKTPGPPAPDDGDLHTGAGRTPPPPLTVAEVDGEPAQAEEPEAEPAAAEALPVSQRADYESDEWYTPREYIDAARAVMGGIDLDPATSEMAQTVVQATVYLTRFDDGLRQVRWLHQRIWLNPPYSNPAPWIEKLVREHQAGPFCTEAIVLVNNATETSWFQMLLERFPVCLPARRLAFWRHDHANVGARQGQAFFYLGPNVARFQEVFSQFGPILRRMA